MSRNERKTCEELIEPALAAAGWQWDREVLIAPGQVNLSGSTMYDESQRIVADYVLRYQRVPLAILEAKAEGIDAADGMQQGSRYARRLGIRFSIASNGAKHVLTDNQTEKYKTLSALPTPGDVLKAMGRSVDWEGWRRALETPFHLDQISKKRVRPYQEMAIFESMLCFSEGRKRILLLMATGTGKTFTVFQLVWKLIHGGVLKHNRVLFLTDRNSLKDQAYRAFSAFPSDERVQLDKDTVKRDYHRVGKVFFANYQNLDEELDGKKLYEFFAPDFFDLVIVDECHRSGFSDWFGILRHFSTALQLGLTATPREIDQSTRVLTEEEKRRDTQVYFGDPVYTYSLKQAIADGYLVPYLLEKRLTNLDEHGYVAEDGTEFGPEKFERDIRLPDRTTFIAEDLWNILGKYDLRDEKTIVFCVDDTHAAFFAQELRRLSGDENYAARITRSERNSHMLERNFATVGRAKPRVAVTVDLLSTGFDAPDVKNIVFVRPLKSAILYKQMKGRGTRLCDDIDKRYFTIFDYVGASQLEDAEFDGHPANIQQPALSKKSEKSSKGGSGYQPQPQAPQPKRTEEGITVFMSSTERYVCLADGQKIAFDEYMAKSKQVISDLSSLSIEQLLKLWVDPKTRQELRSELLDKDVFLSAFRHFFDMDATDDVDILSKVGFSLPLVPTRHDRVVRFWDQDRKWLESAIEQAAQGDGLKTRFWQTSLDHYGMYGIDDLEKAGTYSAPQFVQLFGSFSSLARQYGGAERMRADLTLVKQHLYVPMMIQ